MSRFESLKENERTRKELTEGHTDIVIGTHAVLANSVKFKNLGLLIIDEEQHFGVRHKERLKQLKSDIHVLTLTATPIPRLYSYHFREFEIFQLLGHHQSIDCNQNLCK